MMSYSNYFKEEGIVRKIYIKPNNSVKVTEKDRDSEDNAVSRTVGGGKYQLITRLELENHMAQCVDNKGGKVDWYNLDLCKKVISVGNEDDLEVNVVAGKVYFKVTEADTGCQTIYDAAGLTVATEKNNSKIINVVFAGSGACIQKQDKKTGYKSLYNFEGYLVG